MDMPAPVADAMMDMGQRMADAGVMPHDVAGEMMPPEGGYEHVDMPADATMPEPMTMEVAMDAAPPGDVG